MDAPLTAWSQILSGVVVAIIGAILGYLIKRKKLPSEVHKTEADANYTDAQAEELRFRTRKDVTEAFDEMAADLGEALHRQVQLKMEIARLKSEIHLLENEVDKFKAQRTLKKLGDSGEWA